MSVRVTILALIGFTLVMGRFVHAQDHPICNKAPTPAREFSWEVEFDKIEPRNGNFALRLTVPKFANPATKPPGGFFKPALTGCKLYRFDAPVSGKYALKTTPGGTVVMTTANIQWAPERITSGAKTHWSKAALRVDFFGDYMKLPTQKTIVHVYGTLHTGQRNRKNTRDDMRLVFDVKEADATREIEELLERLQKIERYDGEAAKNGGNDRLTEILKQLRKLLGNDEPCDELPPASAEQPYTVNMPTDFDYKEVN